MIRLFILSGLLHLLLIPLSPSAETSSFPQETDQEWEVLLHSHGKSPGDWKSVEELQRVALASGIDAVILTEQMITEWEWSPPIIRWFWSFRLKNPEARSFRELFRTAPSVKRIGFEEYFEKVTETDRAVPEITLLAGVEVAPYYYWTGSPLSGTLTMWNWQRNILVFDLPEPSNYRELPVLGLRPSLFSTWKTIPWAVVLALAVLLFLYLLNKLHFVRALLALIPLGLLIWSGPPSLEPFSPYRDDAGMAPYQALIDYVNELDGLSMWSMVETVDDHRYMGVGIHTSKHPEVLVETMNYRSYGIIYPDMPTAHEPGAQWDQALLTYLTGERTMAPWGWGELAFHYPMQSSVKGLRDALTVVLAPDRSPRSIFDALKHGRGYAVRAASRDGRLRLDRFEAVSGNLTAGMGEELSARGPVSIEVALSFTGSEPLPVTLKLIRSGDVVYQSNGESPQTLSFNDPSPGPGEDGTYYRLWIDGPDITHRLLSNPIFIRYSDEPAPGTDR